MQRLRDEWQAHLAALQQGAGAEAQRKSQRLASIRQYAQQSMHTNAADALAQLHSIATAAAHELSSHAMQGLSRHARQMQQRSWMRAAGGAEPSTEPTGSAEHAVAAANATFGTVSSGGEKLVAELHRQLQVLVGMYATARADVVAAFAQAAAERVTSNDGGHHSTDRGGSSGVLDSNELERAARRHAEEFEANRQTLFDGLVQSVAGALPVAETLAAMMSVTGVALPATDSSLKTPESMASTPGAGRNPPAQAPTSRQVHGPAESAPVPVPSLVATSDGPPEQAAPEPQQQPIAQPASHDIGGTTPPAVPPTSAASAVRSSQQHVVRPADQISPPPVREAQLPPFKYVAPTTPPTTSPSHTQPRPLAPTAPPSQRSHPSLQSAPSTPQPHPLPPPNMPRPATARQTTPSQGRTCARLLTPHLTPPTQQMQRPAPSQWPQPPTPTTPRPDDTGPVVDQFAALTAQAVPVTATATCTPSMTEAAGDPHSTPVAAGTGTTPLQMQEPPTAHEAAFGVQTGAESTDSEQIQEISASSIPPPAGPEADAAQAAVEAAEAEAAAAEAALIAARAKAAAAKAKAEAAARAAVESFEMPVPLQPPAVANVAPGAAPSSEQSAAEPPCEAEAASDQAQDDAEPSWLTDAAAVLAATSMPQSPPDDLALASEGIAADVAVADSVTDFPPELGPTAFVVGEQDQPEVAVVPEASPGPEGGTISIKEVESRGLGAEGTEAVSEREGAGADAAARAAEAVPEMGSDGLHVQTPQDDGILEFLGTLAPAPAAQPHTGVVWDGQPMAEVTLWGRSAPAIASVERTLAWEEAMRGRARGGDDAQPSDEPGDVQFVALDSEPPSPRHA